MGYMGYRSRGGAFEVKVIRVQLSLYPNHLHFKGTATGSISHVPHGKLVVLRGTPSKPVVTVVQIIASHLSAAFTRRAH